MRFASDRRSYDFKILEAVEAVNERRRRVLVKKIERTSAR